MTAASLPIPLTVPPNQLLVGWTRADGVTFGFSADCADENRGALACFNCALYWVNGGTVSATLPAFAPGRDSVILRPVVFLPAQLHAICYPFPGFITYENLTRASVEAAVRVIVQRTPRFSAAEVDEIVTAFFETGGIIWCEAGDGVGLPGSVAQVPGVSTGFVVRTWRDNGGAELIYPHVYIHQLRFLEPGIPADNVVAEKLPYGISESVGDSGGNNAPNDVYLVKQRLRDLGFLTEAMPNQATWEGGVQPALGSLTVDMNNDNVLMSIIRLLQGIIRSERRVSRAGSDGVVTYDPGIDGRIDKRGTTERWLWASNAPVWGKRESDPAGGYEDDLANTNPTQDHDYGTS